MNKKLVLIMLAAGFTLPSIAQSTENVPEKTQKRPERILTPFNAIDQAVTTSAQTKQSEVLSFQKSVINPDLKKVENISSEPLQSVESVLQKNNSLPINSKETPLSKNASNYIERPSILAFADSSSYSQDIVTPDMSPKTALVAWYIYNDGTRVEDYSFYLENLPEIKIEGSSIIFSSLGDNVVWINEYESQVWNFSYYLNVEYSDRSEFTIEQRIYAGEAIYHQDEVDVEQISAESRKPSFHIEGGVLCVNDIPSYSEVQLLDASGRQIASNMADANGNARVQLPTTPGTVIVNTGDINFKLLVK